MKKSTDFGCEGSPVLFQLYGRTLMAQEDGAAAIEQAA